MKPSINSLISNGKVIKKPNWSKDSDWLSPDLVDIITETTLNFAHDL